MGGTWKGHLGKKKFQNVKKSKKFQNVEKSKNFKMSTKKFQNVKKSKNFKMSTNEKNLKCQLIMPHNFP